MFRIDKLLYKGFVLGLYLVMFRYVVVDFLVIDFFVIVIVNIIDYVVRFIVYMGN